MKFLLSSQQHCSREGKYSVADALGGLVAYDGIPVSCFVFDFLAGLALSAFIDALIVILAKR